MPALDRPIKLLPPELLWKILLPRKALRGVVVVLIPLAVALPLHQLRRGIEDGHRRHRRAGRSRQRHRLVEGGVDRVRFGRGGEIDRDLRQRQFALGRAQHLVGIARRDRQRQRLRVGHADILARHPDQPPCEEQRILARHQHARQIVQCSIGVRPPHRLVQRRDQIVVPVLLLVVNRRPSLHHLQQRRLVEDFVGLGCKEHLLDQPQQRPPVAIGELEQPGPRLVVDRQFAPQRRLGPLCHLLELVRAERIEPQHLRSRQQRRIELETRILGGRADQHHCSVLHHRQKAVLLGAVEAVDFVDEQQRLVPAHPLEAGFLEHLLEVGHPRKHRRNLLEPIADFIREKPRDGGLARPRRSPQDQRAEPARGDHPPQRAVGTEQVPLADHFVEGLGTQPVGERAVGRLVSLNREEIGHS